MAMMLMMSAAAAAPSAQPHPYLCLAVRSAAHPQQCGRATRAAMVTAHSPAPGTQDCLPLEASQPRHLIATGSHGHTHGRIAMWCLSISTGLATGACSARSACTALPSHLRWVLRHVLACGRTFCGCLGVSRSQLQPLPSVLLLVCNCFNVVWLSWLWAVCRFCCDVLQAFFSLSRRRPYA
jgi:hypothetical protein